MKFQGLSLTDQEPLYLQVHNALQQKISQKEFSVGDKIPTEEELCRIFNVSRFTIREAMARLVDEGYLARRQNHGTFIIASELKKKKEIGVVMFPRDEYFESFEQVEVLQEFTHAKLAGIEEELKDRNLYQMKGIICKDSELSLEKKTEGLEGLIVFGATDKTLKLIEKTGLPFVHMQDVVSEKPAIREDIDIVTDDPFLGVYLVTKHLVDFGHKRIAFILADRDKYPWTVKHLEGYRRALEEADIAYDDDLIVDLKDFDTFNSNLVVRDFLKKGVIFSAVIGGSTSMCWEVIIRSLKEANLKIPQDVSVASAAFSDTLTYSGCGMKEMGKVAVKRLFERIANPNLKPVRTIVPPILVIRKSTQRISI